MWYPHVETLAKSHPVYGIDMPGDPNPSVPRAPMTAPHACAAWLDELLAQLGDRPAHLIGASYGGWVAMNQALRAPARVASITLLEPELTTLMWAGIRGYRMERKFPGVLGDDQLRDLAVPVLLITGARSALITPAQARERAALMPDAELAVVPGSHGGFDRIGELNDRIIAFTDAHA